VILVEPETREGRAIAERCAAGCISEIGNDARQKLAQTIFAEWLERDRDRTVEASRRLISELADGVEPAMLTDERILNAISYIAAHLDCAITLDEVASHVCLSPGRLRHLFVEQVGMGLRPYILWRRFILVWELLMKGGTLSAAAHAAGFADSAHLSRTSAKTFGFPPSALQFLAEPPTPPQRSRGVTE
jgi:AraC family transcriptional regulator